MAGRHLQSVWVLSVALVVAACGERSNRAERSSSERERFVPTRRSPAPPKARERRQSSEPPKADPATRPPSGYRRMAVGGIAVSNGGDALVLLDDRASRGLLLDVGDASIPGARGSAGRGRGGVRLAHDVRKTAVNDLDRDVIAVCVDRLEAGVFFGSLLLRSGKTSRTFELPVRSSDALSLAMDRVLPIFVAETLLLRQGVDVGRFDFRRLPEGPNPEQTSSLTYETDVAL